MQDFIRTFGTNYDANDICRQKHQLSQERYDRKIISKEIPRNITNEKADEIQVRRAMIGQMHPPPPPIEGRHQKTRENETKTKEFSKSEIDKNYESEIILEIQRQPSWGKAFQSARGGDIILVNHILQEIANKNAREAPQSMRLDIPTRSQYLCTCRWMSIEMRDMSRKRVCPETC